MNPYAMNDDEMSAAAIVRRNAGPAALAAALMIYFGFFSLLYPTGSDLFSVCGKVLYFTLRIGGVAMALIALWCMIGQRHALLADAVASVIIGGLLIATGIGMFVDGGGAMQSILYVLFGGMFVSAGKHNWRHYPSVSPGSNPDASSQTGMTHDAPPPVPSTRTAPTTTERLRARKVNDAGAERDSAESPPVEAPSKEAPHNETPSADTPSQGRPPVRQDSVAPPGGYLASFADPPPEDESNNS